VLKIPRLLLEIYMKYCDIAQYFCLYLLPSITTIRCLLCIRLPHFCCYHFYPQESL